MFQTERAGASKTRLASAVATTRPLTARIAQGIEFANRMRDFLDGVGVPGASIVVTQELLARRWSLRKAIPLAYSA